MSERVKLEVRCPCCEATLTVDGKTGEVLFTKERAKKSAGSFEDAVREVRRHSETASDRFDQAFQKEQGRKELIDLKFKEAMERADELEAPVRDIDLD
jgi:hypothetical protein